MRIGSGVEDCWVLMLNDKEIENWRFENRACYWRLLNENEIENCLVLLGDSNENRYWCWRLLSADAEWQRNLELENWEQDLLLKIAEWEWDWELLSTWLHSWKVRSRSNQASGRLSNALNMKTSDTYVFLFFLEFRKVSFPLWKIQIHVGCFFDLDLLVLSTQKA